MCGCVLRCACVADSRKSDAAACRCGQFAAFRVGCLRAWFCVSGWCVRVMNICCSSCVAGADVVDETCVSALLPVVILTMLLRVVVPSAFVFMHDLNVAELTVVTHLACVVARPASIAHPLHFKVICLGWH